MGLKFQHLWLPHKLPPMQVLDGKIVRGFDFTVCPPLIARLMKIGFRDIIVGPGYVFMGLDVRMPWDSTMKQVGEILATPNILEFYGAISKPKSRRNPKGAARMRTVWIDHRMRPSGWHRDDLANRLVAPFVPRLIRRLLECRNVEMLRCFDDGYPGITLYQKWPEDWQYTECDILEALEDRWIKWWYLPPAPNECRSLKPEMDFRYEPARADHSSDQVPCAHSP